MISLTCAFLFALPTVTRDVNHASFLDKFPHLTLPSSHVMLYHIQIPHINIPFSHSSHLSIICKRISKYHFYNIEIERERERERERDGCKCGEKISFFP
jgi:hypothetical protein